jgi:predicted P-loop ATPase
MSAGKGIIAGSPVPPAIPLLDVALNLALIAIPVFACRPDKRPVTKNGFLDATTDPAAIRTMFAIPAAQLIGVPTGVASGFDVLDFDYRHGAEAWETANQHRLPETRVHETMSGGRHLLFKHDPQVRNSAGRIAPGIDVRGEGGYVIMPPSPGYRIISDADVAEWPEWLLTPGLVLPKPAAERPISSGVFSPVSDERFEKWIVSILRNVAAAREGEKHWILLKSATILGGMQAEAGFTDTAIWERLREALPDTVDDWESAKKTALDGLQRGRAKPTSLEDRPRSNPIRIEGPPVALDDVPPSDPGDYWQGDEGVVVPFRASKADDDKPDAERSASLPKWQQYLQTDQHAQVIPNLANAALALRQAPELLGLLGFDEMSRDAVVTRDLPGSKMAKVPDRRPLQDVDVSAIQEWLQRHELRRIGKDTVHQAVDLVARERAYHPVRDYLTGLRWDGTERIYRWLSDYLGARNTPYTAAIGRWFIIGMCARVMRPGCKCDHMPVFEGDQGAKKSTACSILGGPWFSDGLPDLHSDPVRVSMHLRGKWLIEVAEMSSIGKAEAGALKAFLTQAEERYTPKYGRNEVIEPRQCVFIGTTNKSAYLRDETGGRRFWPVKTGTLDVESLTRDRDQLFAEAMVEFLRGEHWWPGAEFEKQHIHPEQENRYEADAWESAITNWLAEWSAAKAKTLKGLRERVWIPDVLEEAEKAEKANRVTTLRVAREALSVETPKLGTADQRRITGILQRIGWVAGRDMDGRWWEPASPGP